ncbi:acyltransferase [Cobetia amphilecti]|uniref:acyltransferase n=1 Tax=Cobetia amphilecti TaxID=1055104 RepID=UPI00255184A5|nr:acyltransferase [Cobetia amphilecti]
MNLFVLLNKAFNLIVRKLYNCLYVLKGLRIRNALYLGRGIRFNNVDVITIKESVSIGDCVRIWAEVRTEQSHLSIDNNVQVNKNVLLDITGSLELKENVFISEDSMLYTHNHGHDPRSIPVPSKLVIEENVWIGSKVIILPSVDYIGARSIIGAGTIVSKDVPPDSIVVSQAPRIISKAN